MNTTETPPPGSLHPVVRPCDVAALFCRSDSVYKTIEGVDVWDRERNALLWPGGRPVIAHPPCRAWGRLAHFAKPEEGEKDLALWAVGQVRRWGGVMEHPQSSKLWQAKELPRPGGVRDQWGGFSVSVDQHWWGHRANKETWLYICGLSEKLPAFPIRLDEGTHCITVDKRDGIKSRNAWKARLPDWEREASPEAFAKWLVQVASLCRPNDKLTDAGH